MCRTLNALIGGLTFALCLLQPGPSALAQQTPSDGESAAGESTEGGETDGASFSTLVKTGRKAYAAEDYATAADAFQRAYQRKQVPNLLYNIGRIYEKAGEFDKAIQYYEKFVNQPGIEIENRKDALDRMETLREVLALREKGQEVDEKRVEEKQSDRGLAEPKGEPAPKTIKDYTLGYVFLSAGAASLIGGGVFSILTANAHDDFENAGNLAARREAADRGSTYGTIADSLLISGGALVATGIIFMGWPIERQVNPSERARLQPIVGRDRAGLRLSIDF